MVNKRPRWRNLLLSRILLFAISIVLSSSGEDIGPNDTIEESLASPHRLQSGGISDIDARDLQSKSAKSSKSNKSSKSIKGSKSKASKISGSKSKSGKASKMGKSSDKSKSSKSKAAKSTESSSKIGKSKSKASKSKSKIAKSLKSLNSGDDTDESRDGNNSSDSIDILDTTKAEDSELSDSVEASSLNRGDIDNVEEDEPLDSSSYIDVMNGEDAVENVDIISTEEEIVTTNDGKTYNDAIQLPTSSEDETNKDTTHLDGDFMEERIDESEESEAFENMFDESDKDLDPSRESVE